MKINRNVLLVNLVLSAFILTTTVAFAAMTLDTDTISATGILNLNPTGQPVTVNGDLTVTGTCTGCGGSGTVGSGTIGQFPYYAGSGTALTATSSLSIATSGNISVGSRLLVTPTAGLDVSSYLGGVQLSGLSGFMRLSSGVPSASALALSDLPAAAKVRTCEIVVGDPGAASPALANDNDTPGVCANGTGTTLTITAVECYADAGTPTVNPIITGGTATSVLAGALTCGTGSFAAGTLNGTPTQANNATIDANIVVAGGTAKYVIIRITRTL